MARPDLKGTISPNLKGTAEIVGYLILVVAWSVLGFVVPRLKERGHESAAETVRIVAVTTMVLAVVVLLIALITRR